MADGPWTKYAAAPVAAPSEAAPSAGPWTKYASAKPLPTPGATGGWGPQAAPTPPADGPSIRAGEPQGFLSGMLAPIREGAIGHALEQATPRLADALGLRPTETIYDPYHAQHLGQALAVGATAPQAVGAPRAITEFGGGLTTPSNLAIMGATSGLGALEPLIGRAGVGAASRLVSAGFTAQMLQGAAQQYPEFRKALQAGDSDKAWELGTNIVLSGGMAGLSARHALTAEPTPLARDLGEIRDATLARQAYQKADARLGAVEGQLRKWAGQAPKPSPEPTPGPSTAPTATLSSQEVSQVKPPETVAKNPPSVPKPPPTEVMAAQPRLEAKAEEVVANPTPTLPAHEVLEEAIRARGLDPGFADKRAGQLIEAASGQGLWNGAERRSAATLINHYLGSERRAGPRTDAPWQRGAAEPPKTPQELLEAAQMLGKTGDAAQYFRGKEEKAQATQTAAEKTARVAEISQRLDELKPQAQKPGVADERAGLMKEAAGLKAPEPKTSDPLREVQQAVTRVVTPDTNPNSPSRTSREADLTKLVDQHAQAGKVTPQDLRDAADKTAGRADAIAYHLDVQGAKADLQAARKGAGVERIRTSSYAEPGEEHVEEGQQRPGQKLGFVDQASTARRTVLDMLGGYRLTAKRLYDAETGKVERNFKTQPLTQEESEFARGHQAALADKVKAAQASKAFPSEAELSDMEGHVTAIEASTGMKMVYSGKGSELSGFDPSRSALNELVGRGAKSHLADPLARGAVVRDRLLDSADLLHQHADRLEGRPETPKEKLDAERARVSTPPAVTEPTPVSTPTPATAEPPKTQGPLDHAKDIAPQLLERSQQISDDIEARGGPEAIPTEELKALQARQAAFEKAADDPSYYQQFPGSMKLSIEKAAREGQRGAIRLGMLVPPNPVTSVRDWIQNNRGDETTLPGKVQDIYDRLSHVGPRFSAHLADAIRAVRGAQEWTNHYQNRGEMDLHMRQSDELRKAFDDSLKALVPNKLRRIAITNYLEAGGDLNILKNRELGSKGRFRRGYQIAQQLSPLEKAAADGIRESYNNLAIRAQQAGVLHSFLENYVNHVYKQLPPGMNEVIRSAQSGELRSNPSLAMQRVWDTLYTAEQKGAVPEKDVLTLHSAYMDQMERAIASRAFVKNGTQIDAADGRPVFAKSGNVTVAPGDASRDDAVMIKPHGKFGDTDTTGYRQVNHTSMRNWHWSAADPITGLDTYMQGDLLVHPDHYAEVKSMLESSKVRDYTLGRGALKVASGMKNAIFLGTGFHPAILSFHGLEFGVNFTHLATPDVRGNPLHQQAVVHGLKLDDYSAAYVAGKSFEETSPFNAIPGFGRISQAYQHWVFHDLQPKLKISAYEVRYQDNSKTYAGKLSDDQIHLKTATEVNNAFGGQDWSRMGVSKTVQDLLHIGMIAPDFGLSRGKYIAQSLNPVTHLNQTKAVWAKGALGMYALARISNMILDDKHDMHWDPKDAFAVYHQGQRYTFRSAQQDLLDAAPIIGHPFDYAKARVGPLPQTIVEGYTGRESSGFERTWPQQIADFTSRALPLGVQQGLNSPDASWWQAMASSTLGMHAKQALSPAEEQAMAYRAGNIPRGQQYDLDRERLKMLRSIRRMGSRGDMEGMAKALTKGTAQGVLAEDDADKLMGGLETEYLPQIIKGLSLPQLFDVYRKANPKEREMIGDTISDAVDRQLDSTGKSEKWKEEMGRQANELFRRQQ